MAEPQKSVEMEDGEWLIIRYDGGTRAVSPEEIGVLAKEDHPVEIR